MKDTSQLVEFESGDGELYAHVKGEIDHHSALYVREAIDKEIFAKRPKKLFLELLFITTTITSSNISDALIINER